MTGMPAHGTAISHASETFNCDQGRHASGAKLTFLPDDPSRAG